MEPLLLIDTASPTTTVALRHENRIFSESTQQQRQAAQQVLPLLERLLSDKKLKIADLGAIAVINGPGSFTGMRIGVAVTQGLSRAASVPAIPVSSLAAMALSAASQHPARHWLVALPGRDDEHYIAAVRVEQDGHMTELLAEQLIAAADLPEVLQNLPEAEDWSLAGSSFSQDSVLSRVPLAIQGKLPEPPMTLAAVFDLVASKLASKQEFKPEQALPNYVKEQLDYS
ncbi:MAG: tRNA (adenosine(37)-N6)-threonylcarbamoyltransferase complex dimerization subunit type 1 TsaB [Pseudomonadales bacterium]|nr:tRNA (adenosine(37)-N6)-threonylcarbamoyltransferase complex dimerization subunit type 1 TsaB [Pseudomonadales bacterium]